MSEPVIVLRQWESRDCAPFAELNADPEAMRHFPKRATTQESDELVERCRKMIELNGWGPWAVEVDGAFAGFTGLSVPTFTAPFTPCVEVGWRFRREFWGRSIAFRAAQAAVAFGFDSLKLPEIVSFTAPVNVRSWRLMERLGFTRDPAEDFVHPRLAKDHPLSVHVLYRKKASSGPHRVDPLVTIHAGAVLRQPALSR